MGILKEVGTLLEEGKIHRKLIFRIRILFIICIFFGGILIYNLLTQTINIWGTLIFMILGFPLGFYVFSRMNVIQWNEEDSVIQVGRMDYLGLTVIILYIGFDLGIRIFIKDFYPVTAGTLIFAAFFGTLLGRAFGTVAEIHRVFKSFHPN